MGYNSMPYLNSNLKAGKEVIQNDDMYPWARKDGWRKEKEIDPETKYAYGNHFLCVYMYICVTCVHINPLIIVEEYMI